MMSKINAQLLTAGIRNCRVEELLMLVQFLTL